MMDNKVILKSINEMICKTNTIQKKQNYLVMKFSGKDNLIDISTRVNIPRLLKAVVSMKYYYRLNPYSERDSLINPNKTIVECQRYSAIEILYYVIQCK